MNKDKIEIGTVIARLKDNYAKVKIPKTSSCDDCSEKGFCNPFGSNNMIIKSANKVNAQIGSRVRVAIKSVKEGKAIVILYVIPLIALLSGAFIGKRLWGSDAAAAALSFIFLIIAYLSIRYYSYRKYESKNKIDSTSTIIEILK